MSVDKLHSALIFGDISIVRKELIAGVDVNANVKDITPLYSAVGSGSVEIVKLLLESNAIVNGVCPTAFGNLTPLYLACDKGYDLIVRELCEYGANIEQECHNERPLYVASLQGHANVIEVLVEFGANVNSTNEQGFTPLYIACFRGQSLAVHALLNGNADKNLATSDGDTPLHIAVSGLTSGLMFACQPITSDRHGVLQALVSHGANVHQRNSRQVSPLSLACHSGIPDVIATLLTGSTVNLGSFDCISLLVSSRSNKSVSVRLLLAHSLKHSLDCVPLLGDVHKYESERKMRVFDV